jgi:hypothetical protein
MTDTLAGRRGMSGGVAQLPMGVHVTMRSGDLGNRLK